MQHVPGLDVARMIKSTSSGFTFAIANAFNAASLARLVKLSSPEITCLFPIPVRDRIHVSFVSTSSLKSSFVRACLGSAIPTPAIRAPAGTNALVVTANPRSRLCVGALAPVLTRLEELNRSRDVMTLAPTEIAAVGHIADIPRCARYWEQPIARGNTKNETTLRVLVPNARHSVQSVDDPPHVTHTRFQRSPKRVGTTTPAPSVVRCRAGRVDRNQGRVRSEDRYLRRIEFFQAS